MLDVEKSGALGSLGGEEAVDATQGMQAYALPSLEHSVKREDVTSEAPTMCWEQPPTLPWPPMEDTEFVRLSSAGVWQPLCFSLQEVCCHIKHLFFFKPVRGRGEEGEGGREGAH